MKTKVVPMREYPQEIEETVQKINKCLNISLFDWQIGYIFYVTAKEVYFSLKNIKGIELREIIFA